MAKLSKYIWLVVFICITFSFFSPFFIKGLLPIPSDALVGLYHPYRDLYAANSPRGIPFKNPLITDPVRQIYVWKQLAINNLVSFQLPLWNPYEMAGKPLLGNFQSSPFYPLNILFFIGSFPIMWSIFIFFQLILGGIFMFVYLLNLKLDRRAVLMGTLAWVFSGFFTVWLEWGNIGHTVLWLPLILLSIDKLVSNIVYPVSKRSSQFLVLNFQINNSIVWGFVFVLSLISSFFAGHLQMFFYLFVFSFFYLIARWVQYKYNLQLLFYFLIYFGVFIILTAIQWIPTLQFIQFSARSLDQNSLGLGWFIPYQNLIQFIIPDFFGNPTTGNYWGVWNYAEFVGYIGIVPLIFSFFAFISRHDKKTYFFAISAFSSLILALPNLISNIPFVLSIPFISSAQPTRLIFITTFSLCVLSAFGLDIFLKNSKEPLIKFVKKHIILFGVFLLFFSIPWILVVYGNLSFFGEVANVNTASRNLILPTFIFIFAALVIIVYRFVNSFLRNIFLVILLLITIFDLFRFAIKFTPFTQAGYLYPSTKIISYLQNDKGIFRISSLDRRILPPNVLSHYKLQSIEGYDPLYLARYAELIAASERGGPNISSPFGFNRIITPHNYESKIIDLLGVKYILSLTDLSSPKLKKVFQEGQTRVYENVEVLPRAFFVKRVKSVDSKNQAIQALFRKDFNAKQEAVFEPLGPGYNTPLFTEELPDGQAEIIYYSENKILIKTSIAAEGFLILTDSFYPTWRTKIYIQGQNDLENTPYVLSLKEFGTAIFRTDYNFRGVIVPAGKHVVEFYNTLSIMD